MLMEFPKSIEQEDEEVEEEDGDQENADHSGIQVEAGRENASTKLTTPSRVIHRIIGFPTVQKKTNVGQICEILHVKNMWMDRKATTKLNLCRFGRNELCGHAFINCGASKSVMGEKILDRCGIRQREIIMMDQSEAKTPFFKFEKGDMARTNRVIHIPVIWNLERLKMTVITCDEGRGAF